MQTHRTVDSTAPHSPSVLMALLLAWPALTACAANAPDTARDTDAALDTHAHSIEASAPAAACSHAPFALTVTELDARYLTVALRDAEGAPVLAGEWDRAEARYRPDTLLFLGRYAAELGGAAERALDFTEELALEAVAELSDLGGEAHRAHLLAPFEGEARAAADQLALAAASLGSLLARAPVVRAVSGDNGGTCGLAPGFFPHACAEHANCYALSLEQPAPTRADCDARFRRDLQGEATFLSEPFVELLAGAAHAYGWRAWPAPVAPAAGR